MKTFFAVAIAVAIVGVSGVAVDSAEARIRGGGAGLSTNAIQAGPRASTPVIRPERIGTQQFPQRQVNPSRVPPQQFPPRQVNGPRESGRGINCRLVGAQYVQRHVPGTSRFVQRLVSGTGHMQCPQRI